MKFYAVVGGRFGNGAAWHYCRPWDEVDVGEAVAGGATAVFKVGPAAMRDEAVAAVFERAALLPAGPCSVFQIHPAVDQAELDRRVAAGRKKSKDKRWR